MLMRVAVGLCRLGGGDRDGQGFGRGLRRDPAARVDLGRAQGNDEMTRAGVARVAGFDDGPGGVGHPLTPFTLAKYHPAGPSSLTPFAPWRCAQIAKSSSPRLARLSW